MGLDQHITTLERQYVGADFDVEFLATRHGAGNRSTVGFLERFADRRNQLAITLSEHGQIRLDSIADEPCVARDEFDGLDVEFLEDLLLVILQRLCRRIVRCANQQAGQWLPCPYTGLPARGACQPDDLLYNADVMQQFVVPPCRLRLGPGNHVHAVGRIGIDTLHEILVHVLREERYEWRHEFVRSLQALVKRQVGLVLVLGIRRFPEATAIAAHVPVAELIDERLDRLARGLGIVIVERFRNDRDRLVCERERPAVDFGPIFNGHVSRQVDVVQSRVQNEKTVGVPERVDERARDVGDDLHGYAFRHVRRQPREEIPPQRIGADRIEHVVWIDDIAD